MEEKEFIQLANKKGVEIMKEADKHFIFYLANIHVFLTSMTLKGFKHLSNEDKFDLGLFDDINSMFESISRHDQKTGFLFNVANVTFNLEQALTVEAYNQAFTAFQKIYKFDDKEAKIKFFEEKMEYVIESIQAHLETEEFFTFYEKISNNFSLRKKEVLQLQKDVKNQFDDMIVFDVKELIKNFEKEALEFKGEMK